MIKQILNSYDLGKCEVDEKIFYDGRLYYVEEIVKNNVFTNVVLENEQGDYRQISISK